MFCEKRSEMNPKLLSFPERFKIAFKIGRNDVVRSLNSKATEMGP